MKKILFILLLFISVFSFGQNINVPDSKRINVANNGADTTGTNDVGPLLNTLINNGFRYFYFQRGTYLITTTVALNPGLDSIYFVGDGSQSVIKMTSNIKAFYLHHSRKIVFKDLGWVGTFGGGGNTNQICIFGDTTLSCQVSHNYFNLIAGWGVNLQNSALVGVGNQSVFGAEINDNVGETNQGGIWLGPRQEYTRVIGNSFADGSYGAKVAGGNNTITANSFTANGYNLYLDTGANQAHGIVSANLINHAGTANIYCNGLPLGETFEGNMIYDGNIYVKNSANVKFIGGDIEAGGSTFTIDNSTHTVFNGVRFTDAPTWSVINGGTGPGVYTFDDAVNGFTIKDVVNGKDFEFSTLNGVQYIGGTSGSAADNGQQIKTLHQLVGKNGNFDANRDMSMGAARFGDGSFAAVTDMFQVYRTGTTGSTFCVLDNAAGYAIRTMPITGNTLIGGSGTDATNGKLQVTGDVTLEAAGNALRITEGSNGRVGQTSLSSGTKAITINGLTTSSRAFVQLVSPSGGSLTIQYQAVCTSNTLTIQGNIAAGTINTSDNSTLNYFVIN